MIGEHEGRTLPSTGNAFDGIRPLFPVQQKKSSMEGLFGSDISLEGCVPSTDNSKQTTLSYCLKIKNSNVGRKEGGHLF